MVQQKPPTPNYAPATPSSKPTIQAPNASGMAIVPAIESMLDDIAEGVAKIGSGEKPKNLHASPERFRVD